jgi:hypothetical protein
VKGYQAAHPLLPMRLFLINEPREEFGLISEARRFSAVDHQVCSSPRAEDLVFGQHGRFLSGYAPERFFSHTCAVEYAMRFIARLITIRSSYRCFMRSRAGTWLTYLLGSRERTQKGYLEILRATAEWREIS